ncbi:DUF6397 family protein [Streptomyces sp. 8N706]|uniref:DUF6397 family protein n=1 Tax=Streptomyces sp. 8N706 TaxID=3457416 RepID=UPI003FD57192
MAVRERRGAAAAGETLAFGRAAERLGLKPRELDLAVQLEEVRTVAVAGTVRRRVPCAEVERLRRTEDFPDGLRERVRAVGTAEASELMGISPERFTRLAKVGCFSPVKFYINRYRAVVWLYAAVELRKFAERDQGLLRGSTPKNLRAMLDAGEDWRARNWRGRRIGQLARQTDDPWERAAVSAAVLSAEELAEVVDDPYERAYLRRLRPTLVPVSPDATATWDVVERLITADDPDEILWNRISLALSLDEAREARPAPRPGPAVATGRLPMVATGRLPAAASPEPAAVRGRTAPSQAAPEPGPDGHVERDEQVEREEQAAWQRRPEPEPTEGSAPEPPEWERKPRPGTPAAERVRGLRGWLRRRAG